jgi:hypothetical protein
VFQALHENKEPRMFAVNSNLAGNPGFFFVKYGSISSAGQDP